MQERAKGSTFYGFKGGPAGIMKCKYVELNAEYILPYRNQVLPCYKLCYLIGILEIQLSFYVDVDVVLILFWYQQGGFDMICSGRDKIETPEQVGYFFLGSFLSDLLLFP